MALVYIFQRPESHGVHHHFAIIPILCERSAVDILFGNILRIRKNSKDIAVYESWRKDRFEDIGWRFGDSMLPSARTLSRSIFCRLVRLLKALALARRGEHQPMERRHVSARIRFL